MKGLTWKELRKAIREALDADPEFDVETDRINFLDLVVGEPFEVQRTDAEGAGVLVGVASAASGPLDSEDEKSGGRSPRRDDDE